MSYQVNYVVHEAKEFEPSVINTFERTLRWKKWEGLIHRSTNEPNVGFRKPTTWTLPNNCFASPYKLSILTREFFHHMFLWLLEQQTLMLN